MSNRLQSNKPEILYVVAYDADHDFHVVTDDTGSERRIDLHVDGAEIPEREELVGHKIRIEGSHAYIEIAHGVTLCE